MENKQPLLATPQTTHTGHRGNTAEVFCYRCNGQGHYASNCSFNQQQQFRPQQQPQQHRQPQQQERHAAKPVRVVEIKQQDVTLAAEEQILNHYDDLAEFVTKGAVNGIDTDILLDSGAARSVISKNFITPDMQPMGTELIRGLSQINTTVHTYDVHVKMQGLDGICRVAVQDTLPSNTVLLGSDLDSGVTSRNTFETARNANLITDQVEPKHHCANQI